MIETMAQTSANANKTALKRLNKELADIQKHPPVEMSVGPVGDNMFHWEGVMYGPKDSPYEGGMFKFKVDFTDEYPMRPPSVLFVTKVFHPNVGTSFNDGGYYICIDILQDHWTSVYTISQIMLSISSLLTDPNPSSPMNQESAKLWETNKEEYNRVVKQWVKKYASPESLS